MKNMSSEKQNKCRALIHSFSASAAAVGGGLAQLPCSDNAVITPIQLAMVVALGKVFGVEISNSAAKASIASAAGATVGRTVSQVLIGWLPGVGNVINACTAGALTEGLGWMIADEFARQSRAD